MNSIKTLPKHKATSIFLDGFFSKPEWLNKNASCLLILFVLNTYKISDFEFESYICYV